MYATTENHAVTLRNLYATDNKKSKSKSENEDRVLCSKNFRDYLERCNSGKSEMKGQRVSIYDFVKDPQNTKPISDTNASAEVKAARIKLQAILDKMTVERAEEDKRLLVLGSLKDNSAKKKTSKVGKKKDKKK